MAENIILQTHAAGPWMVVSNNATKQPNMDSLEQRWNFEFYQHFTDQVSQVIDTFLAQEEPPAPRGAPCPSPGPCHDEARSLGPSFNAAQVITPTQLHRTNFHRNGINIY